MFLRDFEKFRGDWQAATRTVPERDPFYCLDLVLSSEICPEFQKYFSAESARYPLDIGAASVTIRALVPRHQPALLTPRVAAPGASGRKPRPRPGESVMLTVDTATVICANITALGQGRIVWRRVGASSGSGKERKAGQFDSRPITKASVTYTKAGEALIMFFLTQDAAGYEEDGTPKATMRRVRMDTVKNLSVLP